jgi:poly-gamma-glutamate synthesis protein (capsule biosynthesis protein)
MISDTHTTVVLCGDAVITRPIPAERDPGLAAFLGLVGGADAAFVNLEAPLNGHVGIPAADSGLHLSAAPGMADELLGAGFNLFACANNHALDYGVEGLRAHVGALRRRGMVHAGVGEDLSQAAAPAYLETENARVALVSCASTFPEAWRAGEARADSPGRPGLNPQRFSTTFELDQERFSRLEEISEVLEQEQRGLGFGPGEEGTTKNRERRLLFLRHAFEGSDEPGLATAAHGRDLERNLASVRAARRRADLVIVSVHAHEFERSEEPPCFLVEFARACVDAGTDAVVGHGPHAMRAVEIYRGKPIFYSLGVVFFQYETVRAFPADSYELNGLDPQASTPADLLDGPMAHLARDPRYRECAVPRCAFSSDGELEEFTLHPVTLGHGTPRGRRGLPRLADAEEGARILGRVADLSCPFGTRIEARDGVGRVLL